MSGLLLVGTHQSGTVISLVWCQQFLSARSKPSDLIETTSWVLLTLRFWGFCLWVGEVVTWEGGQTKWLSRGLNAGTETIPDQVHKGQIVQPQTRWNQSTNNWHITSILWTYCPICCWVSRLYTQQTAQKTWHCRSCLTWRTSLEKFGKMSDSKGSLGIVDASVYMCVSVCLCVHQRLH